MKRLNDNNLVIFDSLDQSSPEWLEWRKKGIGSSDVAVLMSPKPVFDRTVGTLWKQKIGYERAVALDNEHIKRGKELEPEIRNMVNEILGAEFKDVCIYRKDAPYLRASLDGFDEKLDCLLEIKSPSDAVFQKYLKAWPQIPQNYYEQMQYQMLVADVEYAYFAFYNAQTIKEKTEDGERDTGILKYPHPYIIKVENDFETQLEIEKRCHLFWRAVQTKTPIGWVGEELRLFHQRPTLILLVLSEQQAEQIELDTLELPSRDPELPYSGSFIGLLTEENYSALTNIKDVNPEHDIKIINLTPSPFGAGDEVELSQVPELIRKVLSASPLP